MEAVIAAALCVARCFFEENVFHMPCSVEHQIILIILDTHWSIFAQSKMETPRLKVFTRL